MKTIEELLHVTDFRVNVMRDPASDEFTVIISSLDDDTIENKYILTDKDLSSIVVKGESILYALRMINTLQSQIREVMDTSHQRNKVDKFVTTEYHEGICAGLNNTIDKLNKRLDGIIKGKE